MHLVRSMAILASRCRVIGPWADGADSDATQEGVVEEGRFGQHQDGDESGQAAEAGDRHRDE